MFYEFYQNNSYGYYLDPAEIVIVEAESAEEANSIALENGIYFCGVRAGKDCSCCGDRWSQVYDFPRLHRRGPIEGEPEFLLND